MKKTKIGVFLVSLLVVSLLASAFVLAARPDTMPGKARNPVVIPAHAVEVAPGVFYFCKSFDN